MTTSNPYAPKGSVVKRLEAKKSEVPSGTIDETVDWVGEDEDRARLALEAEESKGDHARKTLVNKLKALVDG